jgi:hypothetical protein
MNSTLNDTQKLLITTIFEQKQAKIKSWVHDVHKYLELTLKEEGKIDETAVDIIRGKVVGITETISKLDNALEDIKSKL